MSRISLLLVAVSIGACVGESADEMVGERSAALTPVTWTDLVGVSASGNDLTKTSPDTGWNAGAVSVEGLGGDGFVEFTTGEATAAKIAGLSSGNGGADDADIDFGIRLSDTGRVAVLEGGVNRGGFGTYVAGDVFRVEVAGGAVTYARNGAVFYTSALAATVPLRVDTSLRTPGATIRDVVIEAAAFWTDVVGAVADTNHLIKTAPETTWNAGAVSSATIASGDAWVQFTTGEATTSKQAGLSNGNGGAGQADIDFAIRLKANGGAVVYEGGTSRGGFESYAPGDVFQVRAVGGVVSYWKNGVSFYTSEVAPTYPLLLDTSLGAPGATIVDAAIGAGPAPRCTEPQQTLLGAAASEQLGLFSAAGDVLAVAAANGGATVGSVYRRSGDGWVLEQELPAGQPLTRSRVATDGLTIAAIIQPSGSTASIAQIFRHDGVEWVSEGLLEACPEDVWFFPPDAVDVHGDVVALGVEQSTADGRGRVYVYRRTAGSWGLEAILRRDASQIVKRRFETVAVADDWIAGGSYYEVHLFRYNASLPDPAEPASCTSINPGKWRYRTTLVPPDSTSPRIFDVDIDDSGRRVVFGNSHINRVYVFDRAAGNWSLTATLVPYPRDAPFGVTVALGGPDADAASIIASGGRAFVERDAGWGHLDVLPESPGSRVVLGDSILAGDTGDDTNGTDAGAIHVLGIDPVCLLE